jgi:hypothetical protein
MAKSFLIAIPVRNGGEQLKECVRSILAQTHVDFEVVALDNASSDGSDEWLRGCRDPRLSIVRTDEPLTIEQNWARISGIVGSHEYMTVTGHDDTFDPCFLSVIMELIERNPKAALYQTHFRLIDGAGRKIRSCLPIPAIERADDFLVARFASRRDSFGTGYVFRCADYLRVGGIPLYPKLLFADDALWTSLMGGSFKVADPRECFSYRVHVGSTSHSPGWQSLLDAMEGYVGFLARTAVLDATVAAALRRKLPDYASYLFRWAYFASATSSIERREVAKRIDSLLPLMRSAVTPDAAAKLDRVLQRDLFGALARQRWLFWRAQTWCARRLMATIG